MTRTWRRAGIGLLVWLCVLPCSAQESLLPTSAPATDMPSAPPQTICCELPEGTPLTLEILDPISSARAKRGDAFRLRVRDAVSVEGVVMLPAGTEGVGEIVHAEPSRGGGKPGELILAARRLQAGDREVKLRGFKLGGAGKDTSGVALGVAVAAGPFAHFIHGKEIEIPALTAGIAKLAEPLRDPLQNATVVDDASTPGPGAPDTAPAPAITTPPPNHPSE